MCLPGRKNIINLEIIFKMRDLQGRNMPNELRIYPKNEYTVDIATVHKR